MKKRQVFLNVMTLMISAGILLPIIMGFVHALHQHRHELCNSKVDQHVHTLQDNCSDLHYLIDLQSQDEFQELKLNEPATFNLNPDKLVSLIRLFINQSKTPRGPPTDKAL